MYPEILIPFIHYGRGGRGMQCLLYVVGHLEKKERREEASEAKQRWRFIAFTPVSRTGIVVKRMSFSWQRLKSIVGLVFYPPLATTDEDADEQDIHEHQ